MFCKGERVEGLYKNTGSWYKATIIHVYSDGDYLLDWDDGDSQDRRKDATKLRWFASWFLNLPTMRFCCANDPFNPNKRIAGAVIWKYKGQASWSYGGRRCSSGYIIFKDSATDVDMHHHSQKGQVHGNLWLKVFGGDEVPDGVEATGFAWNPPRAPGRFVWSSRTFTAPCSNELKRKVEWICRTKSPGVSV